MSKKKVSKATRKRVGKSVKKAVQAKMRGESAVSKLRQQIPESARSKVWSALVARVSEHAAFKPEAGFSFSNGAIENAARMLECLDIAYEIGSDEERALIDEMRKDKA